MSSVKFCIQIMITDLISHVYTRFSIDFKVVLFPLSALGTFMCQKLSKYATKFVGQFKRKKKQVLQVHVSILWASSFSLTFLFFQFVGLDFDVHMSIFVSPIVFPLAFSINGMMQEYFIEET